MNWEIFRDQIWNFIGVIVACLTLIISLIISFLQKNKKGITYEVLSKNPLLTNKEKLEGKIKILYDDKEVQNVNFLEIKITNVGNVGIPASDYERPIRFIFETEAKIISAEVIKSEPETLLTKLSINLNELILQPVLMNAKDNLLLKVIVSNSLNNDFIVDGRVKDVKEIKKQGESSVNIIFAIMGLIITIIGIVQISKGEKESAEASWVSQKTLSIILIAVGYLFMTVFVLGRSKIRRIFLDVFSDLLTIRG